MVVAGSHEARYHAASFMTYEVVVVAVNLAQAKVRLSGLLDKVDARQGVAITRRGKSAAHLSAAVRPKKPLLRELAGFRAAWPRSRRLGDELLHELRDQRL